MLFKPNTLILIQRNGLSLTGKHLSSARLSFPDEVMRNLEILQRAKFIDLCRQFFADQHLRGKRLQIILDYSVVFEKNIELDQSGKPDVLMEGFVAAMPFEPGMRACLAVEAGTNLRLFATNADVYLAVAEALKAANAGTLQAITPIAAYNLAETERTIRTATERILKDADVSTKVNFRDTTLS